VDGCELELNLSFCKSNPGFGSAALKEIKIAKTVAQTAPVCAASMVGRSTKPRKPGQFALRFSIRLLYPKRLLQKAH
jgi:hypothetical protein